MPAISHYSFLQIFISLIIDYHTLIFSCNTDIAFSAVIEYRYVDIDTAIIFIIVYAMLGCHYYANIAISQRFS